MESNNVPINNINNINLDVLPSEILVIIAKECTPEDLYKLLMTSKRFYYLVMSNVSHYINHYKNIVQLDVEKFMWSLFDDYFFSNQSKGEIFLKMLKIYVFAKSNYIENIWEKYKLFDNENYGPLPVDPIELYNKKFYALSLAILIDVEFHQASLFSYDIDNIDVFEFLFKFIIKYTNLANLHKEDLIAHIESFLEQNMDFDWVDDYIQKALSYEAHEEDIFDILIDEDHVDEYIRLLSYGVDPDRAKQDVDNDHYSTRRLNTYNEVRQIIGNELAHYYILDKKININTIPNFVENVHRLVMIGVNDTTIIDYFVQNPTDANFEYIQSLH